MIFWSGKLTIQSYIWKQEKVDPSGSNLYYLYIGTRSTFWRIEFAKLHNILRIREIPYRNEWVSDCCLKPTQQNFSYFTVACIAEKQQIPILVFCLTRPGLEPTIYHTRGEHANHYTTESYRNEVSKTLLSGWYYVLIC